MQFLIHAWVKKNCLLMERTSVTSYKFSFSVIANEISSARHFRLCHCECHSWVYILFVFNFKHFNPPGRFWSYLPRLPNQTLCIGPAFLSHSVNLYFSSLRLLNHFQLTQIPTVYLPLLSPDYRSSDSQAFHCKKMAVHRQTSPQIWLSDTVPMCKLFLIIRGV